eukprot:m51a1_g5542 hypothetical protein (321) ;mRNA; f:482353-483581
MEVTMSKAQAYEVLGLHDGASLEEIRHPPHPPSPAAPPLTSTRSAYKRLAVRWHPDKNGSSAESTRVFQNVGAAYQRLTVPEDPRGPGAAARYVDALVLFNALREAILRNGPWVALSLLAATAPAGCGQAAAQRTPEERERAWAEQDLERELALRKLSLGFRKNRHPIADAIRRGDCEVAAERCRAEGAGWATDLGLGNTALHFACYFGCAACVRAAMDAAESAEQLKAQLALANDEGDTPVELTRKQCHFSLTDMIEKVSGESEGSEASFVDKFIKGKPLPQMIKRQPLSARAPADDYYFKMFGAKSPYSPTRGSQSQQ